MKRTPIALALLVTAGSLAACGGDGDDSTPQPSVMDLARSSPDLSTLAEAVRAAGLEGTLSGPGPFTVFAPTDAAFAALLAELGISKDELFSATPVLQTVLTYHVLGARVDRAQVPAGRPISTLQGGIFKIEASGGGLVVTDGQNRTARITTTDLQGRNGVVHVVDAVLLPSVENVVQLAQSTPGLGLLSDAVVAADLAAALSGAGPFTVFAPTDEAFAALLDELGVTRDALFSDTALLAKVLAYHVVPGRALAAEIVPGRQGPTLEGGSFEIGADLVVTDARGRRANIVATDVFATNGVVHVIDRVILPAP